MIVQITGDRNWKDRDYIFHVLDDFLTLYGVDKIRCGCAKGADRIAGWPCPTVAAAWPLRTPEPPLGWAAERGIPVDHYPARWDQQGKSAGPRRNSVMAKGIHFAGNTRCPNYYSNSPDDPESECSCSPIYPHVGIAFHTNLMASKGTKHMVELLQRESVPTFIFP